MLEVPLVVSILYTNFIGNFKGFLTYCLHTWAPDFEFCNWVALKLFPFLSKAQQSRQKFLNEHMVKVEKAAIEEENGDEEQPEEKDASSSEICK